MQLRRWIVCLCVGALASCQSSPVSPSASAGVTSLGVSLDKKKPADPPPSQYQPFSGPVALTGWTVTDQQVRFLPLATPAFAFPTSPQTRNYLFASEQRWALTSSQSLSLDFTIAASPTAVFQLAQQPGQNCYPPPIGGGWPPQVTLFFWAHSLNFTAEFDRWWTTNDSVPLANGAFSVTVPLAPARWGSVYGKTGTQAPSQFAEALAHVVSVGLTLGGGCDRGHGIGLSSGSATFTLTSARVQ